MFQRREFLAAVAAAGTLAGVPKFVGGAEIDRPLNWRSMTIQTTAKTRGNRAPVVTGVSLRPESSEIAIVGDDHYVSIYDQQTHRFVQHLGEHRDWVRATRYSPNGQQLVTAGNDRRIMLWSTDTYADPISLGTHPEAVIEVAFSSDGTKIATVGFEETLRIYETESTRLIQKLSCACQDNHAVAFSADGSQIAAGGRCGTIRVWDVASGQLTSEFTAHRKRIRSIEFDSQGRVLSCGEDQMVRLTDSTAPREPVSLTRQSAKLFDVKLIADDVVATAGADNKIHIWRISDSYHVGALKGHTGTVSCLDVNSSQLVSGSYDTQVRVWTLQEGLNGQADRHTQLNPGWNGKLK
jgi:WD40 repeat protein